jgi:hypothetical protein
MPNFLDYYNNNLLNRYPFKESNVDNVTLPIQPNWFGDIIFYSYHPLIQDVFISNITVDTIAGTAQFLFSTPSLGTALSVAFFISDIVDNTVPGNPPYLSTSTDVSSVKMVFGPGFLPLLTSSFNQDYAYNESALVNSAVIQPMPRVVNLIFSNNYPDEYVEVYNDGNPNVAMRFDANTIGNNDDNNLVIDVGARLGTGLFDPCTDLFPTEFVYTINGISPNQYGNLYLVPSPCYSMSLLNASDLIIYGSELSNYDPFSIPYQTPDTFDALQIGHSFLITNNCTPKCPVENLNAFAKYLNRVFNGLQELFLYADSNYQTTGVGNLSTSTTTFTATSFTSTYSGSEVYPSAAGFIKYFHEGKTITFTDASTLLTYSFQIIAVTNSTTITLSSLPSISLTGSNFTVSDWGVFEELNEAIIDYNTNIAPTINIPNGELIYSTSEGQDEFGNYGTFLSIVCVIENPSTLTVTYAITLTPSSGLTVIPGTEKIRYDNNITFGVNSGTLTCKTYATYENTYFAPCGAGYTLEVVAIGDDTDNPSISLIDETISLTSANCPPTITSSDSLTIAAGSAFTYKVTGTGSPTTVTFVSSTLPLWATTNSTIGSMINNILGTSTDTMDRTYSIEMLVSNSEGISTPFTLYLQVVAIPVLTTTNQTADYGLPFFYQLVSTGFPTSYTASGYPTALDFDSARGIIYGTTNETGTFTVSSTASNIAGTSTASSGHGLFNITVSLNAPVVTSASTASGSLGNAFAYQITATLTPTSFSLVSGSFPPGVSLNTSTGLIRGIPTAYSGSPYTVVVGATNGTGTGTLTLTIYISNSPPVVTSASTAVGNIGVSFSYTITASNSPTSYAVSGSLPTGLSLSGAVISGTPSGSPGSTSVNLTATNGTGTSPSYPLTITLY